MTNLKDDILQVLASLGKEVAQSDAESLTASGILDSLSILELIDSLEDKFDVMFDEEDLTLDNFSAISRIETLVQARLGVSAP